MGLLCIAFESGGSHQLEPLMLLDVLFWVAAKGRALPGRSAPGARAAGGACSSLRRR